MRTFTLFISLLLCLGAFTQKQVTIRALETGEEMSLTATDGLVITTSCQEENNELAVADPVYADNACVADTIDAEALNKKLVTQHKWTKYEYVDTCTTRYAVVHDWNGRCGIYDLLKHENITELEYRGLYFKSMSRSEDGSEKAVFYGRKGLKVGMIYVSPNGNVMNLMDDEEELFFSLDSCKTIDEALARRVKKLLKQELTSKGNKGATYGQVIVVDAKTGETKSWIAMENRGCAGKFKITRPREYQCSAIPMKMILATMAMSDANLTWEDSVDTKCGIDTIKGLVIIDHNWIKGGGYGRTTYKEAFKNHSNIAMASAMYAADSVRFQNEWLHVTNNPRALNAYSIAAMYNVTDGESAYLSLATNCDTATIVIDDGATLNDKQSSMCKEILKTTLQEGGIGSQWTTSKVDLSGDYSVHRYCRPTIYDDTAGELDKYYNGESTETYNQVIFSGYLPSDNPRYAICVTMDKKSDECYGKNISSTVNKLAEYLNKHK